jgi:carboxypeptidase C (cathepsin A)
MPWLYLDARGDSQVGGYVDRYKGLDFLTFRVTLNFLLKHHHAVLYFQNAGHFVPADKPSQSLHVIYSFIKGNPY